MDTSTVVQDPTNRYVHELCESTLLHAHASQYAFEVESLINHTFYQPIESAVASNLKLPVILWGNGACSPWSVFFRQMLHG